MVHLQRIEEGFVEDGGEEFGGDYVGFGMDWGVGLGRVWVESSSLHLHIYHLRKE